MKLLGITGGVGMGKSTTARLLAERGINVIDTDHLARQLVEPGQPALAEIVAAFGSDLLNPSGQLRRDALGKIVFADESKRRQLEEILHPRIRHAWLKRAAQWRSEGCPTAAVVIPLLFETKAAAEFDCIICLACTTKSQLSRLAERGWSEDEIRRRIASQWPIQRKIDQSHRVIWTEPGVAVHAAQLDLILQNVSGQCGSTIAGGSGPPAESPVQKSVAGAPARPTLDISPDNAALCRAAAAAFVRLGTEAIQARGCFHVALAGGSTPKGVYQLLAAEYANALPWRRVHLWFGDERHVPPEDPASNYRMVSESLLVNASIRASATVHRIEAELSATVAADHYEAELHRQFGLAPPAQPRFDLILLGMGTDGHTASLFPKTKALTESSRLVVANDVPQLNTQRITLTFPAINRARHVVFLTSGPDKAAMLWNILEGDSQGTTYPCQRVAPTDGHLVWMVDAAAAART